jgi:hypothetical protein
VGPFGIGIIEVGSRRRTILGLHLVSILEKAEYLAVGEGQVRTGIAILGAGVLGLAGLLAYGENRLPAPALPEIQINGNRQPAGQMREGVLYVRLEVMGSWHPEGLEAPGVEVASFGVENGPLQNLGP